MATRIAEQAFKSEATIRLGEYRGLVRSVTGPGRSGAIASVYASHLLGVPWIPAACDVPQELEPVLVVDTARQSGRTLRKMAKRLRAKYVVAIFNEPPRVIFWYEAAYGN